MSRLETDPLLPLFMKHTKLKNLSNRAYTLIEALVGSAVLMIGISAAATMSLSLLKQEEINENTARAQNYIDTAVALYQLGVPADDVAPLLPSDSIINSLTTQPLLVNDTTNSLTFPGTAFTVTFQVNRDQADTRTLTVQALEPTY